MDHAAEYYWYDFVAQNVNENLTHYFYPITSNAKKIFSLEGFWSVITSSLSHFFAFF